MTRSVNYRKKTGAEDRDCGSTRLKEIGSGMTGHHAGTDVHMDSGSCGMELTVIEADVKAVLSQQLRYLTRCSCGRNEGLRNLYLTAIIGVSDC